MIIYASETENQDDSFLSTNRISQNTKANGLVKEKILVELFASTVEIVRTKKVSLGRTVAYFEVKATSGGVQRSYFLL